MKSENTEAFAHIDRQIGEFEELLKELTNSATSLMLAKALLTSIEPAPRDNEERRPRPALLGGLPRRSKKEQQIYEKEQQRHKHIKDRYHAVVCRQEVLERKYDTIYGDTEYILRRYFPSEDDLKKLRDNVVSNLRTRMEAVEKEQDEQFRRNPPFAITCEHYIHSG
jgi:hypothetical protein